jgi:hypothetical protein
MSTSITFIPSDNTPVEFPVEYIKNSELLTTHVESAYDVSMDNEDWLQELVDFDANIFISTPVQILAVTSRDLELYKRWCEIRQLITDSPNIGQYYEQWKEQMRLQKPHLSEQDLDNELDRIKLPPRLQNNWSLAELVSGEELELFRYDFNDILRNSEEAPETSPFNNPPEWHLNLDAHDVPELFPRELIGYWLKEWHFIDLCDLEIPEDITLNAYIRAQLKGEPEQQQENDDPEHPIVIDFICNNLTRIKMPELDIRPDLTISDPEQRNLDTEQRVQQSYVEAEKRIRDTIFIPTKFPEELTEQWLLHRLNEPTLDHVEEAINNYHQANIQHLRTVPHTTENDPVWGIGAEIGELILLGAEKFMDPWLQAAAQWRLSEMTDLCKTAKMHMRMMKYYNSPRTEQFLEASFVYA